MANRYQNQFLYSKQPKLTMVNGIVTFGATGAVSAATGPGLYGVTRLAQGVYKIKLVDNYKTYIGSQFNMLSGITGASVAGGSFVATTLYQIITLGTTTQAQWVTAGFDADYTAAVGSVFVATAVGAGTGTVKALTASNITNVEVAQVQSSLLVNLNSAQGKGSSIIVQTLGATDATTTTVIPLNPLTGSQMSFKIWFRDSSVLAF